MDLARRDLKLEEMRSQIIQKQKTFLIKYDILRESCKENSLLKDYKLFYRLFSLLPYKYASYLFDIFHDN